MDRAAPLTKQRHQGFWKTLDVPGLLGCAALLLSIYGIFWYYSESVKGNIQPGELGVDRALEMLRSSDSQ